MLIEFLVDAAILSYNRRFTPILKEVIHDKEERKLFQLMKLYFSENFKCLSIELLPYPGRVVSVQT